MLSFGDKPVQDIFLGTDQVNAIYLCRDKVYERQQFKGIKLYFNDVVDGTGQWYIEHNIDFETEYIETVYHTWNLQTNLSFVDRYIEIDSTKIVNSCINIYMESGICSMKGAKRRFHGLETLDLSAMPYKSQWYFGNNNPWPELQNIIFPTGEFSLQIISFNGSFNDITINNGCSAVIFFENFNHIQFEDLIYDKLYLWQDNALRYQNFYEYLPNVQDGICGYKNNLESLSETTKQALIDKGYRFKQFNNKWEYEIS